MNFRILLFLSLALTATAAEYSIPSARRTTWTAGTYTGVPGGIAAKQAVRTNIINAVTQGVDNTGATNASAAVQALIDASSENDVIYLPPGTYKWDSTVSVTHYTGKNRTIKGAGNSTIINLTGSANFISAVNNYGDSYNFPASGNTFAADSPSLEQNSNSLTIGSTSDFSVGDLVAVLVNDSRTLPVMYVPNFNDYDRKQITKVTAIPDSTHLTISPALYADFSETTGKVVRMAGNSSQPTSIEGFGVEDFFVDATNSTGAAIIGFQQCYASWISGVKITLSSNVCIVLLNCLQCEVRKCYADRQLTTGTNRSGIRVNASSGCLIEDNILVKIFPQIEVNYGATGNVFAYNFLERNYVVGYGMGMALDTNHGAHNSHNLYEGNIASKFGPDGYYGSASDDTVFRNWFHATCTNDFGETTTTNGAAVWLARMTRNYNIVGNILGRSGETSQLYANMGSVAGFNATSTTSLAIGTGTKVFTVQSGLTYRENTLVKITSDANVDNFMFGLVVTYSGTTLTVNVSATNGSGTFADWTIRGGTAIPEAERYMYVFGMPNLGNGGATGMAEHSLGSAHTWADWTDWLAATGGSGPGPDDFQEMDLDVFNTALLKGNYNYATASIPSAESLSGDTLPDSLYRASKPDWFGSLAWPAFNAAAPGTPAYTQIPAGYRYVNGMDPSSGDGSTTTINQFNPGTLVIP